MFVARHRLPLEEASMSPLPRTPAPGAMLPPAMSDSESPTPSQPVLAVLLANHREFLSYVERRIGDRALAEEILQDAFVRSLDRTEEIRESAIGWFYRVLRNAVIDQQRRRAAT